MRTILSCFILAFGSALFAGDDVKVFHSKPGHYTVFTTNPKPSVDIRHVATKWGPTKVTTEAYSRDSYVSLAVTYTDYPEAFTKVDGAKLLQTVRDEMVKDAIRLDEEMTESPTGKRFGLAFSAKMTNRYNIKAKLFWVGTRLYQVTAIGRPEDLAKAPVAVFVEKFDFKE